MSRNHKEDFIQILSGNAVHADEDICTAYASDWTKTKGRASYVLFPQTTRQVADILKYCHLNSLAVVPSGGRTGLAGGATATKAEVVLSFEKMNKIYPVDILGRSVRVQAGAVTQSVHEHCEKLGLTWPIDLASKGTSQIGGNLATNAGGVRVIRYGMARKWVLSLQIVTAQGEIIELNHGLEKNNTGYDLIQLIIGSEGTLAVITEATLKLVAIPRNEKVFFFSVESLGNLNSLFKKCRTAPFEMLACEFFSDKCMSVVQAQLHLQNKLQTNGKYYLLVEAEFSDSEKQSKEIESWLSDLLESELVLDGMLGQNKNEEKGIWALREGITESLSLKGIVKKYDVAVSVGKMKDFLLAVESLFETEKIQMELYLFGHYGDGSPHLNLLKPEKMSLDSFNEEHERLEKLLIPLFKRYQASFSAEHGVGLLKKHWLPEVRTPFELSIFKAIKRAFDPSNILNPGKILDL